MSSQPPSPLSGVSPLSRPTGLLELAGIFLITILVRYVTAEYLDLGGDNSTTFYFVRHYIETGEFLSWNHHTARWSITLPLYGIMRLFGTDPRLYYVLPFLFSGLGSIFIYLLGKRLGGRKVGIYAFLLLLSFPQMAQTGSQLWPSIFIFPAAALSIYSIYRWADTENERWLILSACAFFYGWGARVSGVYFFPGLLLILWLEGKRLRPVLLFSAISAGLLLLETLILWQLSGQPLGRIGIIMSTHLRTMSGLTFTQFLLHVENLGKMRGLLVVYLLAIAASIHVLKKGDSRWKGLAGMYLINSFLLIYMISSLHPLRMAQPHGSRYWCQLAPFGLLLMAWSIERIRQSRPKAGRAAFGTLLLVFCVFSLQRIPPVNALTQMAHNQSALKPVLGHNARLRFIWNGWSPNWLESTAMKIFSSSPIQIKQSRGSRREMHNRVLKNSHPCSWT